MSKRLVVKRLLQYGEQLHDGGGSYTNNKLANRFIQNNPNAWLFGVIFDQGVPYEKAWEAPYLLKRRLGHFNIKRIAQMPIGAVRKAVKGRKPGTALHRFVNRISVSLKKAAGKLVKQYQHDAKNIWKDCRTAGEVIERLDEFHGIGQKKAHMAARIVHEEYKQFSHWGEINVAVDVHVIRVWRRAGLTRDFSVSGIMSAAKVLNPKYPGELDYPTWQIGMGWCHSRRPNCLGTRGKAEGPCPLLKVCPRIGVRANPSLKLTV